MSHRSSSKPRVIRCTLLILVSVIAILRGSIAGETPASGNVERNVSSANTSEAAEAHRTLGLTGYCGYPDISEPWASPLQVCGGMAFDEEDCADEFYDTVIQCRWDVGGYCTSDAFEAGDFDVVCPFTDDESVCQLLQFFGLRRCAWYGPYDPSSYCGFPDENDPWTPPLQSCGEDVTTMEDECVDAVYNTVIECRWDDRGFCTSDALEAGDMDPLCPSVTSELDCGQFQYFGTRGCVWFTSPTSIPSARPSTSSTPSAEPSVVYSNPPTTIPSSSIIPTIRPSSNPVPNLAPSSSKWPSTTPSLSEVPSTRPTSSPVPNMLPSTSVRPSDEPTRSQFPTELPSALPTVFPSLQPSLISSVKPSKFLQPTAFPSTVDSMGPSEAPTRNANRVPSATPSKRPTDKPSFSPTPGPTQQPPKQPTFLVSPHPSPFPTERPTAQPTAPPTDRPTKRPSFVPMPSPTPVPTVPPSPRPTTASPTARPTASPTEYPTVRPSVLPSRQPSLGPTGIPSSTPSHKPSASPSEMLSSSPSLFRSSSPSSAPSPKPLNGTVEACICDTDCVANATVEVGTRFNICLRSFHAHFVAMENVFMSQSPHGKALIENGRVTSDSSLFGASSQSWIVVSAVPNYFAQNQLVIVEGSMQVMSDTSPADETLTLLLVAFRVEFTAVGGDLEGLIDGAPQQPATEPGGADRSKGRPMDLLWISLLSASVVCTLAGIGFYLVRRRRHHGDSDDESSGHVDDGVPQVDLNASDQAIVAPELEGSAMTETRL